MCLAILDVVVDGVGKGSNVFYEVTFVEMRVSPGLPSKLIKSSLDHIKKPDTQARLTGLIKSGRIENVLSCGSKNADLHLIRFRRSALTSSQSRYSMSPDAAA